MNALVATRVTREPDRVVEAYVALRQADRRELLAGTTQTREITQLRHELMWMLRDLTHLGYARIGEIVGGRDYATVHAGVAGVADRIVADKAYRTYLQALRRAILAVTDPVAQTDVPTALDIARGIIANPDRHGTDAHVIALVVVSAASFLVTPDLTDAEALMATRSVLFSGRDARG
jgi:hypothetical protein